ncbi:ribonucleotide reductase [Earliella scabrosa]|nr:ribonucleotide reductase [Earliella scabrosa]
MLTAQMPTASTSHILGNSEGVEPYISNMVTYQLLGGDYTHLCPWLVRDLTERQLWSEEVRTQIMRNNGSVQSIDVIPEDLKEIYRTAWELEPFAIVDMAADRAPFIDQSQSMTLHVPSPSLPLLRQLQTRAWERGLKTGVYYMRTKSPARPLAYGLDTSESQEQSSHGDELRPSSASDDEESDIPPLEPAEETSSVTDDSTSTTPGPDQPAEASDSVDIRLLPWRCRSTTVGGNDATGRVGPDVGEASADDDDDVPDLVYDDADLEAMSQCCGA